MNMAKSDKRKRGFTLLELIVVITIIGLLGTLVVAKFGGVLGRAHKTKIQTDLQSIVKAAEMYHALTGYFPETMEELKSGQDENGNEVVKIGETKDPWGNEYEYQLIDGSPHAFCYGRDGTEGGEGENLDYSYPEEAGLDY